MNFWRHPDFPHWTLASTIKPLMLENYLSENSCGKAAAWINSGKNMEKLYTEFSFFKILCTEILFTFQTLHKNAENSFEILFPSISLTVPIPQTPQKPWVQIFLLFKLLNPFNWIFLRNLPKSELLLNIAMSFGKTFLWIGLWKCFWHFKSLPFPGFIYYFTKNVNIVYFSHMPPFKKHPRNFSHFNI